MDSYQRWRRYGAFLFAGGTGFVLYMLASNALHYLLGLTESMASFLGTLMAVLPTYCLQRAVTFRGRQAGRHALPMYAALQLGNATLVGALSAVGTRTSLPSYLVFLFAGMAGVLLSYWFQSRLIFRERGIK